jgi:imidazolonepropionase-like amidohydrolase
MEPVAIVGVHVWDGVADSANPTAQTLRIESGRIAAIGAGRALVEGCRVHEWPGAVVMPGLIDAHVHLWLDPEIMSPADQQKVPPDQRAAAMAARAQAMLLAGITTARDLGGPDGSELVLRDRILRGELPGPRLLCARQPLTTRKGHCWFWGGEAESDAEIEEVVERQVDAGCDWIKVMATGGIATQGSSPAAAQYTTAQLERVVAAARGRGRPVAAHAHGTEGIRNAALAGVDTVEHCSFVGSEGGFGSDPAPEVIERLAAVGACVSATINAGWGRFLDQGGSASPTYTKMRHALRRLQDAGVPLIASTDAGIPRVWHHDLPRALPVFGRFAGMSGAQVLRSATSVAARALGLGGVCGRLEPGLSADLLVLGHDATRDLGALERPLAVVARGQLRSLD